MKRTWKVKITDDRVSNLAADAVDNHSELMAEGFQLMGSSGVWRTKHDGLTARFVYRRRDEHGTRQTRTFVFRGIRP